MVAVSPSDDWGIFAYGLLVCVATICVAYVVLAAWPRSHYPRLFAALAGIATVAAMYVFQVSGAGFGLGALVALMYIAFHVPESIGLLFEQDTNTPVAAAPNKQAGSSAAVISTFALGSLFGLLFSLLAVSALLMPPTY